MWYSKLSDVCVNCTSVIAWSLNILQLEYIYIHFDTSAISGLSFCMFSSSNDWTAFQNTFLLRMNLISTTSYKPRKNLHEAVNCHTKIRACFVMPPAIFYKWRLHVWRYCSSLFFFFYSWAVASVSVMKTNFCCLCTTLFVCIKVGHFLVLYFGMLGCSTQGCWRTPNYVPEKKGLIIIASNVKWRAIRMYCGSAVPQAFIFSSQYLQLCTSCAN